MSRELDIENIGRIGVMFIDGDLLRDVLVDPLTCDEDDTDYNIPAFNKLKSVLSKIERMNPDIYLTGTLWQWYPRNARMASPAVVGTSMPKAATEGRKMDPQTGWMITDCSPPLAAAMKNETVTFYEYADGRKTYYFPVMTSAGDVVGALELSEGGKPGLYENIR